MVCQYQFAWQLLTFSFTDLVEDLLLREPDESRASLREEAEAVCIVYNHTNQREELHIMCMGRVSYRVW